MHSRNPNSNGSRNVMNTGVVDTANHQEENTSAQDTLSTMHPHPYLNYHSHPQMMGMSQMAPAHGTENPFQVTN